MLQFLAFRLSEVKLSNEHLTADLNMTMVYSMLQMSKNIVKTCTGSRTVASSCNASAAQLRQHDKWSALQQSQHASVAYQAHQHGIGCTTRLLTDDDHAH